MPRNFVISNYKSINLDSTNELNKYIKEEKKIKGPIMYEGIEQACNILGLQCYQPPNNNQSPTKRYSSNNGYSSNNNNQPTNTISNPFNGLLNSSEA